MARPFAGRVGEIVRLVGRPAIASPLDDSRRRLKAPGSYDGSGLGAGERAAQLGPDAGGHCARKWSGAHLGVQMSASRGSHRGPAISHPGQWQAGERAELRVRRVA